MPTVDANAVSSPLVEGPQPRPILRVGVLLLLILSTAAASWLTHRTVVEHQQSRFEYEVRRVEYALVQRMNAYVQVLRGALGLFEGSGEVSRAEWSRYVETLRLEERYPGFKALSFLAAVRPEDLDDFVARVRAEPVPPGLRNPKVLREFTPGLPQSAAGSTADAPLHVLVHYIAPLTPDNELAIGRDQMREPGRRAALERSAALRDAVLSPRLRMPQVRGSQVGFIAYLPVMRGSEPAGWLTAAFFADGFMDGLLGELPLAIDLEIYDGAALDPEALLYSTAGVDAGGGPLPLSAVDDAPFRHTARIDLPGRQWSLRYVAAPGFIPLSDRLAPWLVAGAGLLATLLFYAVARAAAQWRAQAARLASQAEQLRRAEAAVRHQATHDPLTGLANRALFLDRLNTARDRALRSGGGFVLAYIDIDDFKPVNDRHGHHVGDALLCAIADRLRLAVRREDTVARLGGDEFALVLEGRTEPPGAAERLCDSIIDSLCQPYTLGPHTVRVGASVGLALFPLHAADCDALVVAADGAMYEAKRSGKQRCVMAQGSGEADTAARVEPAAAETEPANPRP